MLRTICLRRDIDQLFEERKNLARSRKETSVLSSIYVCRSEVLDDAVGIYLLLIVPKKFVKHSNKRNAVKRWIREALRLSPQFKPLDEYLAQTKKQVLLGIRGDKPPSSTMNFKAISSDIEVILSRLKMLVEKQ